MRMIKSLIVGGALFFFSQAAWAGPASCALAIKGCASGGKDVAAAIKTSRDACKNFRDCKKICKQDHKTTKKTAKGEKQDCKKTCHRKKGKAKRTCMQSCRQEKKGTVKSSRRVKKSCVANCQADFLSPKCKKARRKMVGKITSKGLGCAIKVTAACGAPAP